MALDYLRQYAKQKQPESECIQSDLVTIDLENKASSSSPGSREAGTCFVSESVWPEEHIHGLHPLGGLSQLSASALSLVSLDTELAYVDLSRAIFLDTETTGLNMGTGTYVFLVGAGYFDGDAFRIKQFFMRSPGEEGAFLSALDTFLRDFSVLVTFNGKAFDWPLLESRFIGHRDFRRSPLADPPHIDLLHPARRLWKRRLESCALSSLEDNILGVKRTEDDVPGWLIPSLYFQFLRTNNARPLQKVFYHNLHDILSLAALTLHMERVVSDPLSGLVRHSIDFYCLGRTFERAGNPDMATTCYEEALRRGLHAEPYQECLSRVADVSKRERRWEAALYFWDLLLDEGGGPGVWALIERAKYHEHVEKDFLEALNDVEHALRLFELQGDSPIDINLRELEHRRARLLNRVFRNRSWAHAHT